MNLQNWCNQAAAWMQSVDRRLAALEQASGERAASPHRHLVKSDEWLEPVWTTAEITGISGGQFPASSPITASPTTDSPSDAADARTVALTRALQLLRGGLTEAELFHVALCSECQDRLAASQWSFRTHAQAVHGITSTYQSPASLQYVDAMAPAQSPSNASIELKRPTLVLKDENAGTAPVGIDSSVGSGQ